MSITIENKGNFLELNHGIDLTYVKKNTIISLGIFEDKNAIPDTRHNSHMLEHDPKNTKYKFYLITNEIGGASGAMNNNDQGWHSVSKNYNLGEFSSRQEAKAVLDRVMEYINS